MELLHPLLQLPSTASPLWPSSPAPPSVPTIGEHVFADTAYAADRVRDATSMVIGIVRKMPGQPGFAVQPRRRVVEWCRARFGRNRCVTTDVGVIAKLANVFRHAASAMLLIRRSGCSV